MTVREEIADPGTRETAEALLSLCGFAAGASGPEGVLRIADYVPGTDADPAPGERVVFLMPRALSGEAFPTGGSGGRTFFLPVPILLEEGIRVLTEAVRSMEAEQSGAPVVRAEKRGTGDSAEARPPVSFDGKTVTRQGQSVHLTPREAACFRILYGRRGETVSREELAGPAGSRSNLADVYVGYLRKKLRPLFGDGVILAVRGKGYLLKLP